jgi:hypothetical protein
MTPEQVSVSFGKRARRKAGADMSFACDRGAALNQIHHQDTKNTKFHQESARVLARSATLNFNCAPSARGCLSLGETWCSWCLGGESDSTQQRLWTLQ